MNEIFRFLMMRPPEPADPVQVGISTKFRDAIDAARSQHEGHEALRVAAADIVAQRGLGSIDELAFGAAALELGRVLGDLMRTERENGAKVAALVKDTMGAPAASVVKDAKFQQDRERLCDLLIAAKILSRDGDVSAVQMENVLRVMALLDRMAAKHPSTTDVEGLAAALTRATLIDAAVIRPPRPSALPAPPSNDDGDDDERRRALRDRAEQLQSLADELANLRPEEFVRPDPGDERPADQTETAVQSFISERITESVRRGEFEPFAGGKVTALLADLDRTATVGEVSPPSLGASARLRISQDTTERFTAPARDALKSLQLDLTTTPVPDAMTILSAQLSAVHTELASLELKGTQVALLGSSVSTMSESRSHVLSGGYAAAIVPTTHGSVQPVGIGDLLVVRQHIRRYEGGELAHVENVLDGERRKRALRRARTTEQTTTLEVETKKDEERDSQSTERFELQREASTVLKEDQSFKAGLSVSGSYGPTIEFKASADFAMNSSKEEAAKTASKYSKEVTERAVSKVSERRREERILRTLEVFEETNEHGIENPAGNGHVIGAYQWVDKVYEAQVYNYGKRLMFDFMVPEPGAFWLHANASKPKPGSTLTKPMPFTLTPAQLTEYNYTTYVQRYQVAGVKPPPAPYTTVAKTFEGSATNADSGSMTKIADVPIPDGYQAVTAHVCAPVSFWKADYILQVAVGKGYWLKKSSSYVNNYFTLDRETGAVPVAIKGFHVEKFAAALEIDCQRTPRALDAWRLETHAAITQGWLKMESDYQDELASLEVQAANAIQGRNPVENRIIERTELKKGAIATITAQHFDLFGAISYSPQGYPQPNLSEADAEGRYTRFFEQAFEWEQMMYQFYPYYWGRKSNWISRSLMQDSDQQFAEFLKAGAARVVVPVRPGFETAVAHFLDTGEIWEGADPPLLTSPLYVSIIQEIKERDLAPGTEVAQGEPWNVKLATTLVRLRPDGSLPVWAKNPAGEWAEA